MSANPRIIQQGDGLSVLKDIIELVNKPELIKQAHATYRDELALTEAQEKEAQEARDMIAKYPALAQEIENKNKELLIASTRLETNKAVFSKEYEEKTKYIDMMNAQLIDRETALAAKEDELKKREILVAKTRADIDNRVSAIDQEFAVKQSTLDAKIKAHAEEVALLDSMKKDLDVRAKKITLREQAAEL